MEITEINSMTGLITVLHRIISVNEENRNANINYAKTDSKKIFLFDHLPIDKNHVLSGLLNSLICLYHTSSQKQIVEVRYLDI